MTSETGKDAPRRRFGSFEVDFRSGELRKRGVRIGIQEKPLRVLEALLQRPGQVVTRDELRHRLWADATFVDFDHGINIAVSKLRQALGDASSKPRFVETLARHGYRFFAPVGTCTGEPGASQRIMLAVLPFVHIDGEADDYFSDGLTEEMITRLGRLSPRRLGVIARMTIMRYQGASLRIDQIGKDLGVEYILEGSVRRWAGRIRITAQLIQVCDQTHLWAETYDRKLSDVLDIQRNVTRRIARSLQMELLPEEGATLSRARSRQPDTIGAK